MSLSRSQATSDLVRTKVIKKAIVLGNGLSAAFISLELAGQGYGVEMLLPGDESVDLSRYAFPDERSRYGVAERLRGIGSSARIRMHLDCEVSSVIGSAGDFEVTFTEMKEGKSVKGGVLVLAQDPFPINRSLGTSVISNAELRSKIDANATIPNVVAFIVGWDGRGSCQVGGSNALIENALALKMKNSDAQIFILAKDIGAPGEFERTYLAAQKKGVIFFRGDISYRFLKGETGGLVVKDPVVGEVKIHPDLIVSDDYYDHDGNSALAMLLGLSRSQEGKVRAFDTRLHAGETIREGVFVCQGLNGSISASDNVSEACAVASSVSELLSKEFLEHGAEVAFVDKEKCSACLACVRICPYDAPFIGEKGKAEIRVTSCQGCGICVSLCPSKAIDQRNWTDARLSDETVLASKGVSP